MTVEKIMTDARTYMRDHPRYFVSSVARTGITLTFDSGHPNVMPQSLSVVAVKAADGTTATGVNDGSGLVSVDATHFGYIVDEREGLIRVNKPRTGGFDDSWAFTIEGYYYTWIADVDLRLFANNLVSEHAWHREDWDPDNVDDVEADAMALGAAVEALYSVMIECSLDIDVNTPEGVGLPVTQRFHQVQSLLYGAGGLAGKYASKAGNLGVGLDRIEMITLTRTSRTTNRLVPKYRPREWDDARIPTRIFSPIGIEGPTSPPPDYKIFPSGVQGFYDVGGSTPNP